MKFSQLETITYIPNSSNPQFTPFNFILDRYYGGYYGDSNTKAILLSQLPVIFKKYDIPLYKNDLLLWFNPNDNVADYFDISKIIEKYETCSIDEKKEIEFMKEVFVFFKKIEQSDKEKMIQELICKRYGYYYNSYNKDSYDNFRIFLDNSIKDGFIPYNEIDINQDFTLNEKEHIEQKIRRYFYDIKKYFPNKPVVFLSDRFQKVYEVLVKKYPEISFDKYYSKEDFKTLKYIFKLDAIFLNDINYELDSGIKDKKYVPHYNFKSSYYRQLPERFIPRDLNIIYPVPPYLTTDVSLKKQLKIYQSPKILRCISTEQIEDIINYLETEREILIENGVKSTINLLPNAFQEYFLYCSQNSESIYYLKERANFYSTEKNNFEVRKCVLRDLLNNSDFVNVPDDLIAQLFADDKTTSFLKHMTIVKEPKILDKSKYYYKCRNIDISNNK